VDVEEVVPLLKVTFRDLDSGAEEELGNPPKVREAAFLV